MAEVVRCDICGCVEQPQQTSFVKLETTRTLEVFNVSYDNHVITYPRIKKDICSSCHTKLMKFLRGDVNAIEGHS